ncbi:MAG TPA: ABC transporter ATP-binding protein [Drouetiella sp.]
MTSNGSVISAQNLSVGFDKIPVLDQVSLELHPGEITAIAGPNGVGKSTLVKTLARQLRPITGSVKLGEQDIWNMPAQNFARQVAYVPQDIESSNQLTVEQMVFLGRNPHQQWWQWNGSLNDAAAVEKALADTELKKLRHTPMTKLSGGERQRAVIAVAMAQEPAFIFLDEPTSHLDFKHQIELLALLKRLKTQNIGIMLVLHDLNVIARIADTVILLDNADEIQPSRIAARGNVRDALSAENLKKVFHVEVKTYTDPNTGETVYNPFSVA